MGHKLDGLGSIPNRGKKFVSLSQVKSLFGATQPLILPFQKAAGT
jgi:hypothetical protein